MFICCFCTFYIQDDTSVVDILLDYIQTTNGFEYDSTITFLVAISYFGGSFSLRESLSSVTTNFSSSGATDSTSILTCSPAIFALGNSLSCTFTPQLLQSQSYLFSVNNPFLSELDAFGNPIDDLDLGSVWQYVFDEELDISW